MSRFHIKMEAISRVTELLSGKDHGRVFMTCHSSYNLFIFCYIYDFRHLYESYFGVDNISYLSYGRMTFLTFRSYDRATTIQTLLSKNLNPVFLLSIH